MSLPLLKACSSILAHVEEKYPAPALQLGFGEKKQTTQLSDLLTGERLRRMMKGRNYYGVDTVLTFVAAFTDRSLGFVKR